MMTLSLCPTCYKTIPAEISLAEENSIVMLKECSEHGEFFSVVESDALFYEKVMINNKRKNIYGGHFIDVTERCNMKCNPCFFPVSTKEDRPIENILQEAAICGSDIVILTGGEPLIRNDIDTLCESLVKSKHVEIVSNCKLFSTDMADAFKRIGVSLSLSYHPNDLDAFWSAIDTARKSGFHFASILFAVKDIHQIKGFIEISEQVRDVCTFFRLKAQVDIWNHKTSGNHIFTSDLLHEMIKFGASIAWFVDNKVSYTIVTLNNLGYALVSWYNIDNVDLLDIDVPPTYMARTGHIKNFVTSLLINEGMQKGWLNGARIA